MACVLQSRLSSRSWADLHSWLCHYHCWRPENKPRARFVSWDDRRYHFNTGVAKYEIRQIQLWAENGTGSAMKTCPSRMIMTLFQLPLGGTSRVHEQSLGFPLEARCTLFLLEIVPSVIYLEHKLFPRCCSWRGCQAVCSPFRDWAVARFMSDLSPFSSGPRSSLPLWVVSVKLLQSKPSPCFPTIPETF